MGFRLVFFMLQVRKRSDVACLPSEPSRFHHCLVHPPGRTLTRNSSQLSEEAREQRESLGDE